MSLGGRLVVREAFAPQGLVSEMEMFHYSLRQAFDL